MESKRKTVLCPLEKRNGGGTYWMKIGSAFTNRDGSLNVYLDALPANSRLQIREPSERDLERAGESDRKSGGDEELPF